MRLPVADLPTGVAGQKNPLHAKIKLKGGFFMILRDKILTLRKASGLSQEQLAAQLGVSRQSVSKWETGTAVPELDKLRMLSDFFHVSADYLIRDEWDEDVMISRGTGLDDQKVMEEKANTAEAFRKRVFFVILGYFLAFLFFRLLLNFIPLWRSSFKIGDLKIGGLELTLLVGYFSSFALPIACIITLITMILHHRRQ